MAPNKTVVASDPRNARTAPRPAPGQRAAAVEQAESKSLAVTVKETLESIVVAFILAFVFRAFIVEAFIIPTGSMAVTLYGKQLTKTCSPAVTNTPTVLLRANRSPRRGFDARIAAPYTTSSVPQSLNDPTAATASLFTSGRLTFREIGSVRTAGT